MMVSPWFKAVNAVPTTMLAISERLSIGQCRNAQPRHLVMLSVPPLGRKV